MDGVIGLQTRGVRMESADEFACSKSLSQTFEQQKFKVQEFGLRSETFQVQDDSKKLTISVHVSYSTRRNALVEVELFRGFHVLIKDCFKMTKSFVPTSSHKIDKRGRCFKGIESCISLLLTKFGQKIILLYLAIDRVKIARYLPAYSTLKLAD